MRINFFENALLNNPVRGWIFRNLEARRFLEAGGKTRGGLALESRFYIEEILEKYIVHPVFRRLLDHPRQDRFDHYTLKKRFNKQASLLCIRISFGNCTHGLWRTNQFKTAVCGTPMKIPVSATNCSYAFRKNY